MRKILLSTLACITVLIASGSAATQSIVEYFLAIPRQTFTEGSPDELLAIIKRGESGSFIDSKNGFMRLTGDGAQVSLQIALFRYDDKSPLLAVAWGELEQPDFTHLTFFHEKDGKMVVADRTILPVADSTKHRFELPRHGRTVTVRDAKSKVLSKWTWDGKHFQKE